MRVLRETHITLLPSIPSLRFLHGIASAFLSMFLDVLPHPGEGQEESFISLSEQLGKIIYCSHSDPHLSSARSPDLSAPHLLKPKHMGI